MDNDQAKELTEAVRALTKAIDSQSASTRQLAGHTEKLWRRVHKQLSPKDQEELRRNS